MDLPRVSSVLYKQIAESPNTGCEAYFHQHSAYFNMEDDLQTLWSVFIDEDSPVKDGLDSLINLTRLGVTSRLMSSREEAMLSQLKAVADWVEKLKLLQSLRFKSFDKQGKPWQLPKMDLTGHTDLSSLYLLGRIAENNFLASMLPEALTELTLSGSRLSEDPMPTLGKLPKLRILRLFWESFLGNHMRCPSGGFPQLRILKLWKLEKLKGWKVEKGALSDLIDLEIRSCQNLEKLPDELRYSRTLQKKFSDMPGEWGNVRNDRFAFNEEELGSQIREKLEECEVENRALSDLIDSEIRSCQNLKKLPDPLLYSRALQKLEFSNVLREWEKTFLLKIVSDELLKGSKDCPFCGAEPESAVHLFFLCEPVKMIWFAKWVLRLNFSQTFQSQIG
ncbi:hypothetical protein Vadar_028174 [Vaccinium darrowii]|uniref:Uncharacterized protein n=1 Tax=Vaccinium darrowii TaxID=229202 RepID=A0ACB7YZ28_9ERIC|nr:hypothetical protein Vadar_028174 [Vaccinium darrowii]